MNFVELITLLGLLVVGAAGLYAGVVTMVRRVWDYPPHRVTGGGAVAMGLLLLAGAVVALTALAIIATGT